MSYDGLLREPTGDQCNSNEKIGVSSDGHWHLYACWYPQMGGYCGAAIIAVEPGARPGSCFEVYVWHDGEFPFNDDDDMGRGPVRHLHHCMAEQFINFGETVLKIQELVK